MPEKHPKRPRDLNQWAKHIVDLATGNATESNPDAKKVENHAHAMALHFLYYNFVRIHKTLRTTPAMAAGVTKRLWEMSDIVDVLEAWEAAN